MMWSPRKGQSCSRSAGWSRRFGRNSMACSLESLNSCNICCSSRLALHWMTVGSKPDDVVCREVTVLQDLQHVSVKGWSPTHQDPGPAVIFSSKFLWQQHPVQSAMDNGFAILIAAARDWCWRFLSGVNGDKENVRYLLFDLEGRW